MLAPESKDVVPGMEVELIISPEQFGTVLKLEGNRVRVDFSASGGKSAVYHTQDELKPKDGAAVGRKQALFCGREGGLLGVKDSPGLRRAARFLFQRVLA